MITKVTLNPCVSMEYSSMEYTCCIREEKHGIDGWSLNTGNFHCCATLHLLLKEELFG